MSKKKRPIEKELQKIGFALESDKLTPEERYALVACRRTIFWFLSFSNGHGVPSPTASIIPTWFQDDEKTVCNAE